MSRLIWGNPADRVFEAGVDRGVLYPQGEAGVSWDGLISISENPSDTGSNARYFNGAKYHNKAFAGSFAGRIEAYTYPDAFSIYDGYSDGRVTQQKRLPFGLSYRTKKGEAGYRIHLVYNVMVSPSNRDYISVGHDAATFSWNFETVPVAIPKKKATAHIVVDTTVVHSWTLATFENVIYGSVDTDPRLPLPDELLLLFEENAIVRIVDYGDGTWSAEGPDDVITMINATTFQIDWPSAIYIDERTYEISSL